MAFGYQNPFYLKKARKKQQSLYDEKVLFEKHDPPIVHDSKETLQLAQEIHEKMKQMNKEIKPANYTKINHLLGVFVPQTALSREELYFSNNSKTANVSKSFSIPNEDLSNDTTPSVARKFLNEVKSTIVTLQRVVKQRMTIETHNWSSSAHQELHKIVRDENFPIIIQVNARLQNFKIQFLKEAAKFVGDFKSLANEADTSLAKHKALELEIECLLKAVVSHDIMIIVQNECIIDTSDLQTELERTKERFENCIMKKEKEYGKLWNEWYKKCDECKYDKISYDKAYKDMQQKIERLQAQLGDLKGKSKDTSCVSDTRNSLSQKLKNENVELEFQDTNENTKFAKQPIVENLPKIDETNALSKPVTSNSVSTPQESKGVNNNKDVISKVICAMCKKCLISVNHDKCVQNYVNGKHSRGKKQKAKVSFKENQMKYQPKVSKSKKVESHKSLATPKPRKFRLLLRWSPTGRLFDQEGKIVDFSESISHSDCVNGDNACTSNSLEPKIKRFPNSTSLLD
nr:hypothetical protein [Tanacetum cinerariifolium]